MKIAVIPSLHRDPERLTSLAQTFASVGIEPRIVVTGKRLDDTLDSLGVEHRSPRANPGFGASIESAIDGDWDWLFISNDDIELESAGLEHVVAELDAMAAGSEVVAFLDPGLRRAAPTPWTVFRSVSLLDAVLRSRLRDAPTDQGPWYKSFSLVAVSRPLWEALDGFSDALPYTYEDADFAVRAWLRQATLIDTTTRVATHEGSETSKRVASRVLPVSAYSACRYLEARGVGVGRARLIVASALVVRVALVPASSVDRADHLRAIKGALKVLVRWKTAPTLPPYLES